MSWLSVKGLEAGYGNRRVLFDASVEMEQSEVALVVGPNGSGKSTLLRTIFKQSNFCTATEFRYDGCELNDTPLRTLMRAGLAYTPQYRNVFNRLTIRENLMLPMAVREGPSVESRMEKVLENFPDLVPMLKKPAGQSSGGQRQLLALAMGLSVEPKLLLLDEPLAGLDERSIRKVTAIIQLYRERYGVAFLIVEHRFTKLTTLADRCYGMRLGRTVVTLDGIQLRDRTQFESALQQVFVA